MSQYRPSSFQVLPTGIKNLLIINGIFFIATLALKNVPMNELFAMHYITSDEFRPWQFLTYMFMHGNWAHIFFNMFALWMFGAVLENYWGAKRFIFFYIVCGLGAALTHLIYTYFTLVPLHEYASHPSIDLFTSLVKKNAELVFDPEAGMKDRVIALVNQWDTMPKDPGLVQQSIDYMNEIITLKSSIPVMGASGSVFGVLLAFGMMFPNSLIYVYFAIPVKAKWFVVIYGLIELFSGIASQPGDNVAHFAHLGGMLFGFILIKVWQRNRTHFY